MKALTPRQLEAARRNLRMMDPRTDWQRITGPVDDLRIPVFPLPNYGAVRLPVPDYGTAWLPDGQRVAFVEGGV